MRAERERTTKTYQGLIHNHSSCSGEGSHPLAELRQRWASHYQFAAMTEHAEKLTAASYVNYVKECDELSDAQFRFIPGLELATESGHMLILGSRKYICTRDPLEAIREAAAECVILLAHPEMGQIIPAVLWRCDGLEVWNSRYMGRHLPPYDWLQVLKTMLHAGQIMTGGNDIHQKLGGRKIMLHLQAESAEESNLLWAIKAGRFVVTNGRFGFTFDGQLLCNNRLMRGLLQVGVLAGGYRMIRRMLQIGKRWMRKTRRRIGNSRYQAKPGISVPSHGSKGL